MKVNDSTIHHRIFHSKSKTVPSAEKIIATGTGVTVELKGQPRGVIKNNNPKSPLVSKKILDSLDLGLINFNQRERDVLAKIMGNEAEKVKSERPS